MINVRDKCIGKKLDMSGTVGYVLLERAVRKNEKLESFKLESRKLESFAEVGKNQAKLERTD